jgi:anti-sigma regulatory factor (Ser/Thr protein kinase)
MRAGAARGALGCFHEAGFYGSEAEFRAFIVPFAEEGIAAGEPVIVGYDDDKADLLRSWLRDPSGVTFVSGKTLYSTPTRAIAEYRRLAEPYLARGASQVRMAGDVPQPANGGSFDGWDRYESALNTVWGNAPVWSLCLYDSARTPAAVLDIVERAHPRMVSASGEHRPNDHYQDGSVFAGLAYAPDPLEATAPVVELVDRPAAEARHTLTELGRGRVPSTVLADLLIGVTEAINNALRHGRPPTTVRIWAAADRIVVTVHDTGPGPADRLAGLVPAADNAPDGGLGLWLVHQLDTEVTLHRTDGGFTIRLRGRG